MFKSRSKEIYGLNGFELEDDYRIQGSADDLKTKSDEIMSLLSDMCSKLEPGKVYKMLWVGWTDEMRIHTSARAVYITANTSPQFLYRLIYNHSIYLESKYHNELFVS